MELRRQVVHQVARNYRAQTVRDDDEVAGVGKGSEDAPQDGGSTPCAAPVAVRFLESKLSGQVGMWALGRQFRENAWRDLVAAYSTPIEGVER